MNGRSKVVPVACPAGGGGEAAVRGFEPMELYELRHRISQRGWRGLCLGLGPKMSLSEKRSERALLSAYTRQPGARTSPAPPPLGPETVVGPVVSWPRPQCGVRNKHL